LCFDGDDGISTPEIPVFLNNIPNGGNPQWINTTVVTQAYITYVPGIAVGQLFHGIGVPVLTYITSVSGPFTDTSGNQYLTIGVSFTAVGTANTATYNCGTGGGVDGLTSSSGFPLPAATWMNFDNSSFRNVQNKAIYGICASSTTDLRIQGG
jgi:hypothetical protein